MKSTLLGLFAFLLLGYANAQPVLTSADILQPGDMLNFQYVQIGNISLPTTGANQIWDYSGIIDTVGNEVDSFINPLTTPYYSLFPGTNLALTDGIGDYQYYQTNSSDISELGQFAISDTLIFQKPFSIFHYPFSYNSFFVDSSNEIGYFSGYQQTITEIDSISGIGYGTLVLPGQTYNNVLEVSLTEVTRDEFGDIYPSTSIYFFMPGFKWSLFQINLDVTGAVIGASYSTNPLITVPLTWLSFNAKAIGGTAGLTWQTAGNLNTSSFTIERSTDGIHFTSLEQVMATTGIYSYTATDIQPLDGSNFYRIKEIDKNGSYSYSSIVHVSFTKKGIITVTPTIVQGQYLTLTSNIANASKAQLYIMAADGKILMRQQLNIGGGLTSQPIDIDRLPGGLYFINIATNLGQQSIRFIKQ
jgi:hypothetical protein